MDKLIIKFDDYISSKTNLEVNHLPNHPQFTNQKTQAHDHSASSNDDAFYDDYVNRFTKQADDVNMSASLRLLIIRLMRINHCGEVCAQNLYLGQIKATKNDKIKLVLAKCADEEKAHLSWTKRRIYELGGNTSYLANIFGSLSFVIGYASGICGDDTSMGFLIETEKQVESHLKSHIDLIGNSDTRSKMILEKMRDDEIEHANTGSKNNGAELPYAIKLIMKLSAKVMTTATYYY